MERGRALVPARMDGWVGETTTSWRLADGENGQASQAATAISTSNGGAVESSSVYMGRVGNCPQHASAE